MADPAPVLVLGAAGFFGLAIVRALTADGTAVVACDRVEPAEFIPREGSRRELLSYVRRDLTVEPFSDLVAEASGVVHAAALTPPDEVSGDTAERLLRINLESLLALLSAARANDCPRILFVSSAGVYDQRADKTLAETDADGGTSLYGAAKLAAEIVGCRYCSLTGLDFGAVRPTSLFGAGEMERPSRPRVTAFAQLVMAAHRGESVRIVRPEARTDWLCVDDAAEAIVLLWRAERLGGRVYNLSSARPRRFGEVANEVAAATGLVLDDHSSTVVDGGVDRAAMIDNRELRSAVGWQPRRAPGEVAHALLEGEAEWPAERGALG